MQGSFAFCQSTSSIISEDLKQAEGTSSEKLNELGSENKLKIKLNEKPNEVQTDPIDEIKESVYKALECQKALAKSIEVSMSLFLSPLFKMIE